MISIKLVCSLIIIGSCTFMGIKFGDTLRKRVKELNELMAAIYLIKTQIHYTFTPLPEIFNVLSKKNKEPLKTIFENISISLYANDVDSVYEAVEYELNNKIHSLSLKKEDKDIFMDLAKSLGDTDIEGQNSILELTEMKLKKQIEKADLDLKNNLKIYQYLGFTIGATIVILIV
ncbi:stage III sporulation protein SpoIIIAB [Clostridium grantii]|uniref:Stage III sporulation protein AB n=1 Tax=Clostridium grantii DSM 8605 TaxID=1121316 RepID=A0A1M5SFS4_9CLOT|nr:stage III sporulation protein SpoIIIAB [Clostridium grantii]SHH37315.1 stage III sporulation protein AB [Clostridium grantii DSM 8605]